MQNKRNPFLYVLLPVVICALLLGGIPTALILTGHTELVRAVVSSVSVPAESVFSSVCGKISDILAYFTEFDALKEENAYLREQLASMEDVMRDAEKTLEENAFLSEFLELKENHTDYRFLACEVVAEDDNGYRRTLMLNAGTGEGAAVGNPVITSAGVVGRITEIGVNWARVTPVTELSSAVGAYAERSGTDGVAIGSYAYRADGKLLFSYLGKTDSEGADIREGDRIRTSGVNSFYPRGLLIGTVERCITDPATTAVSCVIVPAVDTASLRDVMIITDFARLETTEEE